MNFKDIIGQEGVKNHLISTVTQNRISHAQLFLGKEGYGSLPLALAYAKYIMCTNRKTDDSCGECPSCKKIEKYEHPDLHFAFPVVAKKSNSKTVSDDFIKEWRSFVANNPYGTYNDWIESIDSENAQAIIRADEGKEILKKLNFKSFESEYKIMIIWLPEKMNVQASNKLLKLIEEPPEKTLFFLVSTNSQLIINTILSRTQLIKINRIEEDEFVSALQKTHQLEEGKAKLVSRLSEGDYNLAKQHITSTEDENVNFDLFVSLMRLSYSANLIELIKWTDDMAKFGRERQKTFLTYCLHMIRENLVLNQEQPDMTRMFGKEKQFADKFSNFIHPTNAPLLSEEINKAFYHISRNANAKVVFLDLAIRLNRILKMQLV
jgi:DNA polymerase-3 subunit delta'